MLVAQDAMRVGVFVGDAPPLPLTRADERLALASLDFSLSLDELRDGTTSACAG